MSPRILFWLVVISGFAHSHAASVRSDEYRLYFLGGQSNMDGYGFNNQLPADLTGEVEGVRIFCGNPAADIVKVDGRGTWAALKPGYGVGFTSDGQANKHSDRFGPELTFGLRIRELSPNAKIAIIKYSRGGTSIDPEAPNAKPLGCWAPDFEGGEGEGKGINQFDHFLAAVEHALATSDIDGDGTKDQLVPAGIVWMQGESDAFTEPVANRYEANLKQLMEHIRARLAKIGPPDDQPIPIVIGRVADSGQDADGKTMDFCELVQKAQAGFVEHDKRAAFVESTANYKFSDQWHYDSDAYLDLGRQFADALHKLNP